MKFGEQIKAERRRLKLTQSGAAKKLGYSKASVEKWERGIVTPKPLTQVGILTLLSGVKTAREIALEAALEDANGMCRSATAIAERNGEANWPAFEARLRESLIRQHAVMYPGQNDQSPDTGEKKL